MGKPLDQSAPRGGKIIKTVSTYTAVLNFGQLEPRGSSEGLNAGVPDARLGDVCMGVSALAALANELTLAGTVVANGVVRVTANYDGDLTDGVDADNTEVRIVIAHIER